MTAQPMAMSAGAHTALAFDRATGRLTGASRMESAANVVMQLALKATAPFHHRGFSFGCRVLKTVLPQRDIVVRLADDTFFAFPFADGYWMRLLDRADVYEPEIDVFLRSVADVDCTFLDCGANFGFWSVLATSSSYGAHDALAIEASRANAERLRANAHLNGDRFTVLQRAIAGTDGGSAWLAGSKHEGMSIVGSSAGQGEEVAIISLDGLLDRGLLKPGRRLIVKLDVEGVEIEAIKGGRRLLSGDAVLIVEDHGSDRTHRVTRFLMEEKQWALFVFDPAKGRFARLTDLSMMDTVKASSNQGYNIFAATSAFWQKRLAAAQSATHH